MLRLLSSDIAAAVGSQRARVARRLGRSGVVVTPPSRPLVTVALVTYDAARWLPGCLASLEAQDLAGHVYWLVAKIPWSRRGCVTAFGHRVLGASVRLRQLHFPAFYAEAV